MATSLRPTPEAVARWRAVGGFAIGAALVAAAIWTAWTHGDHLQSAWKRLGDAPWWLIALALALPLANLLFSSLLFGILNARYARVRGDEMFALISAATLFNYLPLRPGMFARIAWHKRYHGIAVSQSTWVLAASMLASSVALALLLLTAAALAFLSLEGSWGVVLPLGLGVPLAAHAFLRRRRPELARLAMCISVRYLDTLVWAARYAVVFALVGHPLSASQAVTMAVVSQMASIIPLAGNGLGLREWAIGLTAASFGIVSGHPADLSTTGVGLSADLVHRGLEVLVALPVGAASSLWLARIRRRRLAAKSDGSQVEDARSGR